MSEQYLEQEDKYEVGPQWAAPDLDGLVPPDGLVERDTVRLSSTYYDTADHDLLGHGVTVRRRNGDVDAGWQAKLPNGTDRTEIRFADEGRSMPKDLRSLLLGLSAGRPMKPVAKIDTVRQRARILDAEHTTLAEIADDEVHAATMGDTATVSQWREVEVELVEGDAALRGAVGEVLADAGARPAQDRSKLARALGSAPVDETANTSDRTMPRTVGDVVEAYLRAQYEALLDGDVALRRGHEVIHRTRVATRRYRSVLRVFADLFDHDRAATLDAELAWYADLLGQVRDREVMRGHLDRSLAALPSEIVLGPVAADIDQRLLREQLTARTALDRAMRGRRYLALLADLKQWRQTPPVTPAANAPTRAAARYLRQANKLLVKRLTQATRDGASDELLHRARKAGKRTRYTAELAAPVVGKRARRTIERATALQDVLGAHQDSIVSTDLLRRLGAASGTTPGHNGFTYGVLYADEKHRGDTARSGARELLRTW